MKIQSINSNQTFEGKRRFISQETRKDLVEVLTRLNHCTKTKVDGNTFSAEVPNSLTISNKAILYDKRYFVMRAPDSHQAVGASEFVLGNKSKVCVVVNNKTGEIIHSRKPFFMTWNKLLKKVNTAVSTFKNEFNNSDVVKQGVTRLSGLTKDGLKMMLESFSK